MNQQVTPFKERREEVVYFHKALMFCGLSMPYEHAVMTYEISEATRKSNGEITLKELTELQIKYEPKEEEIEPTETTEPTGTKKITFKDMVESDHCPERIASILLANMNIEERKEKVTPASLKRCKYFRKVGKKTFGDLYELYDILIKEANPNT
jgi:hypothetical protein